MSPVPSVVISPAQRAALRALALGAGLSALSLRVTDALLPELSRQYAAPLADVAWVVTAFGLAYGLSLLLLGPLGERFGKLRVIACSCLAAALASVACALAGSLGWLIAARGLSGAAMAAVIPLSMAWIGDQISYQHRQPVLARFLLGQITGMSLGVGLGGLAADYLSITSAFGLIALGYALLGYGLLRLLPHAPDDARPATEAWLASIWSGSRAVLAQAWPRKVLLTVAAEGALLFGVIAFGATHLHRQHGVTLSLAAGLMMLFGLGGAAYALNTRRLLQWWGEQGLVRVGGAVVATGILLLAWTPWWPLAMLASTLCGMGYYMMHNTLQVQATQMIPELRAVAVSLFAFSFFMGQALGVAVFSRASALLPLPWIMTLSALSLLALALAFSLALRKNAKA